MRTLFIVLSIMLLCGAVSAVFDEDIIWISRMEDQAGVTYRVEVPLISFDGNYADPEEGVASLFANLTEAVMEISDREAAIAAAENEIKRMKEEIVELRDMVVASEMLMPYQETAAKCAKIMKGEELSRWLQLSLGPVMQVSIGQDAEGEIVPSFAWWLLRK